MQEIITGTTKIYEGRIVKLSVHDVRLPDSRHGKREIIHHSGAVAVVVVNKQKQVLLVRQFRLPVGKVILEIPAGTLNPGEDPAACAARELQEETGYKPLQLETIGGVHPAPGYTTEFIHLFLATETTESSLDGDMDEFVQPEWMPLQQALDLIEQGEITDSKTVAGLLRTARRLGL